MKPIKIRLVLCAMATVFLLLGSCSSVVEGLIGGTEKQAEEKPAKAGSGSKEEVKEPVPVSGDPSEKKLLGTWTNPKYNGEGRSARLEYAANPDGTIRYIAYDNDDGSGKKYEGTITYKEKWIDSEGRLCGKSMVTLSDGMSWETLDRIGADGNSLEVQSGTDRIDPKGPRYSIYYK